MNTIDAIREMMDDSEIGTRELGRLLGKSDKYMSSILTRGSIPRADTLVRIAEQCGYRLELVAEEGFRRIRLDDSRPQ